MKKLLFLFLIFILGCTTVKDFSYYVDNVNIPDTYAVNYVETNSGFAGVDDSYLNSSYVVVNENPSAEPGGLTVSGIISEIRNQNFTEPISKEGLVCFYHEQFFFRASVVCFKDKKLVVFHDLQTKGNHQKIAKLFLVDGISYLYQECKTDEVKCNVFSQP